MNPFWTLLRYRVMTGGEMFTVTAQSSRVYSPSQTTAPPATQTNLRQFFNSDKSGWCFNKIIFLFFYMFVICCDPFQRGLGSRLQDGKPCTRQSCSASLSCNHCNGSGGASVKIQFCVFLLLAPLGALYVSSSDRSSLCSNDTPLLVPSTTVYFYTQPNARV